MIIKAYYSSNNVKWNENNSRVKQYHHTIIALIMFHIKCHCDNLNCNNSDHNNILILKLQQSSDKKEYDDKKVIQIVMVIMSIIRMIL